MPWMAVIAAEMIEHRRPCNQTLSVPSLVLLSRVAYRVNAAIHFQAAAAVIVVQMTLQGAVFAEAYHYEDD